MKKLFPTLTMLIVLCASWCAPAFASSPARGSKVLVPPLILKGADKDASKNASKLTIKSKRPTIMLRLPTQAGKVSKMVTTNLVAKGPSWIAKGDKYYSLCVPNRRMVACAPIVATSVMQDIEVGAMAGPKGEPLLTFKINPATKLTPKRALYAVNYFLTRTNKQVAHFNRKSVSYAPAPRQTSLRVGPTSNLIDDTGGSGGSCTYDDEGGMDCSGGGAVGGGGNEGGGYEGGEGGEGGEGSDYDYGYDPFPDPTPNEPTGGCEGNCEYPTGNNNGAPDPCIDPNGGRICNSSSEIPAIPIFGQLPSAEEPMSMPTCRPTGPFSIGCGRMPPVFGGEPQELPGRTPWFPQSWCDNFNILCSEGQEPKTDAPPKPEDIPTLDWNDPSNPPVGPNGEKWVWHGQPPQGGDKGGYVNPSNPDQSVHPDLDHAPPAGPHWDYNDRGLKDSDWRINPDGSIVKK